MSYIIEYKRPNDEKNPDKVYKATISADQYARIKQIPWIEIVSHEKSTKKTRCNMLK